jgi:CDP-glycerol glycerophosphotransferase (TagB/SpsB family)
VTNTIIKFLPLRKIYDLSGKFPRSKHIWLFGCGGQNQSFEGNSKYLFLFSTLAEPKLPIKSIWISADQKLVNRLKSNGYQAVKKKSILGIYYSLRAGVYVYNSNIEDVSSWLSNGAKLLNLWHGVGIKGIGNTIRVQQIKESDIGKKVTKKNEEFDGKCLPDFFLAPSNFMKKHFMESFAISEKAIIMEGYPRVEFLFPCEIQFESKKILRSISKLKHNEQRVILYAPTWRDSRRNFWNLAIPNPKKLDEVLKQTNSLMYIKAHFMSPIPEFIQNSQNIRLWPTFADVNDYLHEVDLLITDYSSILYDYLLIQRPQVMLYTFDYNEYVTQSRNFIDDWAENSWGTKIDDFEGLCQTLEGNIAISEKPTEFLLRKFWGEYASVEGASLRIIQRVLRDFK